MTSLQLERLETEVEPESSAPPLPYQGSQLQPNQMPTYHATMPQASPNPPLYVPPLDQSQPPIPPPDQQPGVPPPAPVQGVIESVVNGVEGVGREIGAALGLNHNQPGYPPPATNPAPYQPAVAPKPDPRYEQPYQPPYLQPYPRTSYAIPYRKPSTAFLLELLGYVGFLGIGHIYAGNVIGGILMLLFGWALVGIAYVVLSILSLGLGFIVLLPVLLAVPIISGVWAYRIAQANNRRTHAA
jgi:hypothetical protein